MMMGNVHWNRSVMSEAEKPMGLSGQMLIARRLIDATVERLRAP